MTRYKDQIWRKSWDSRMKDLDPNLWEITVPEALKDTFNNYKDKMAFSFQGLEMTYGEIDEKSNRFAQMLLKNGFDKGDIVGINLPNIPEYVYSVVGTLKAGCIVSGVSPLLSDVQMQYQINDLGASQRKVALVTLDAIFEHRLVGIVSNTPDLKLVITTSVIGAFSKENQAKIKAVKDIPSGKVTPLEGITVLDYWDDVITKFSHDPIDIELSPDDVALIQYTGGTTGPPKGAMLTHRNVAADIRIVQTWLNMKKGDGCALSGFPFFHAAGLFFCLNVMYMAWFQVLIPDPRDTMTICNDIKKYKPKILVNVPSLYLLLLNTKKFKRLDHANTEICVSGASPFPVEAQKRFENIVGEGKLLEMWGMTETVAVAAMNPKDGTKKLGSIGLPIPNNELKLVDPATDTEVLIGEPGEICVKGPQIMKGYYNKPEETANVFDKDGFLHTGDVAIMDEEGYMRIVDRTKDMIIVGGFKVFSTKLEDTMSKHPAIGVIATVGLPNPDRPGSEIVKAFIQLDPSYNYDGNEEALKEDIINFAKENCAPYEVPKKIEFIDEVPLTTVGKVDKKVLRKLPELQH